MTSRPSLNALPMTGAACWAPSDETSYQTAKAELMSIIPELRRSGMADDAIATVIAKTTGYKLDFVRKFLADHKPLRPTGIELPSRVVPVHMVDGVDRGLPPPYPQPVKSRGDRVDRGLPPPYPQPIRSDASHVDRGPPPPYPQPIRLHNDRTTDADPNGDLHALPDGGFYPSPMDAQSQLGKDEKQIEALIVELYTCNKRSERNIVQKLRDIFPGVYVYDVLRRAGAFNGLS